ncbi:hypothetical protein NXV05_05025 [Parabacteroides johnsonii]|jgi:hypothetical protein|nr:hypothetical protein [Parabacteroides johnsonii]
MDLLSEDPRVIYQFWIEVEAKNEKEAIKKALPTIKQCEDFADSLKIICMCDHLGTYDGILKIRIQFYIKDAQYAILPKVACLFSFAASLKLYFGNQFFLSK